MSTATDYLKTLPVFYINVDDHVDRNQRFVDECAHLFGEAIRVPAVPLGDIVAEANDFSQRVRWSRENADPNGYFARFANVYTIEHFERPTNRAREYAATRSLTLSTLKALQMAREYGYSRFMICDDDAAPRMQILDEMHLAPHGDITVWGGAYAGGGLKKDNERFLAGERFSWKDVKKTPTRFFSQAYEVTTAGSDALEYAIRNHFSAVDFMWWYAFARLDHVWTAQPSAFTQVGESVRTVKHNPKTREGSTIR